MMSPTKNRNHQVALCFAIAITVLQLFRQNLFLYVTIDDIAIQSASADIAAIRQELEVTDDELEIRSWGCNRNETPFIFVHIGKAGGGHVRARLAASSLNLTKTKWKETDGSYYPVPLDGKIVPKIFCNSRFFNGRTQLLRTYEGTIHCHAETPVAHAIACRQGDFATVVSPVCTGDTSCCGVYAGHNLLGSEMHWLPNWYLKEWWNSTYVETNMTGSDLFESPLWQTQLPYSLRDYHNRYWNDSWPRQEDLDRRVREAFEITEDKDEDWSFVYASMPVLRATVVRDPFSWLISKFFWHMYPKIYNLTCDDIETATSTRYGQMWASPEANINSIRTDWVRFWSWEYLMYLCGEDCLVRYEIGKMDIDGIERQAANNLRRSFAVVGLLNETDTFYDMVTARVQYMNTSLNSHIKGRPHSSGKSADVLYCKYLYADPDFQQRLVEASPELAALSRLYDLAVKVNRFQLKELESCGIKSS